MASTQTRRHRRARTPTSRTKRTTCAGKAARPPGAAGDPVMAYAKAVGTGEVVAGPHVRAACERHLGDLKEGPRRGLMWDLAAADLPRRNRPQLGVKSTKRIKKRTLAFEDRRMRKSQAYAL